MIQTQGWLTCPYQGGQTGGQTFLFTTTAQTCGAAHAEDLISTSATTPRKFTGAWVLPAAALAWRGSAHHDPWLSSNRGWWRTSAETRNAHKRKIGHETAAAMI